MLDNYPSLHSLRIWASGFLFPAVLFHDKFHIWNCWQNTGNSTDGINQRAADKILRLFDLQIIYITATLME
jgi:hypothetical protein